MGFAVISYHSVNARDANRSSRGKDAIYLTFEKFGSNSDFTLMCAFVTPCREMIALC